MCFREFPSGSVLGTRCFHCWGHRFNPSLRNENPSWAEQCDQKKKKKVRLLVALLFFGHSYTLGCLDMEYSLETLKAQWYHVLKVTVKICHLLYDLCMFLSTILIAMNNSIFSSTTWNAIFHWLLGTHLFDILKPLKSEYVLKLIIFYDCFCSV